MEKNDPDLKGQGHFFSLVSKTKKEGGKSYQTVLPLKIESLKKK